MKAAASETGPRLLVFNMLWGRLLFKRIGGALVGTMIIGGRFD